MQEDIENKSLTLIINTSKLTARTLATAFMKFLRYSKGKVQAHHDVKPQGRQYTSKREWRRHLRKRKPKRQGSRHQAGKKLPVRISQNQKAYQLAWRKRQRRRMGG